MSYSRLRETYDNEKLAEVYTGGGLLSPPPPGVVNCMSFMEHTAPLECHKKLISCVCP